MKITYAPLVDGASGKFGGAIASPWRSISTVRSLPTRPNPTTAAQLAIREIFRNTSRAWTTIRPYTQDAWNTFALDKNFTARNDYLSRQVAALKGDTDLDDLVGTPPNLGAIPPTWLGVNRGRTYLEAVLHLPSSSLGWTPIACIAFAIPDADWTLANPPVQQTEQRDVLPDDHPKIQPLTPNTRYQVRGFLEYTDPAGATQYSASLKWVGSTLP